MDRNERIAELWKSGEAGVTSLADQFDLSTSRVYFIIGRELMKQYRKDHPLPEPVEEEDESK